MSNAAAQRDFRDAYRDHRASEGRAMEPEMMLRLPYLDVGEHAQQWEVRARTFDAFMRNVLSPMSILFRRPLRVLDLGAGSAWLSFRAARDGHRAVALDIRTDEVDGLGAARVYFPSTRFERVAASFEQLPLKDGTFDLVVFNASLHYALDLGVALGEAHRMTAGGGRIVILDSPFYSNEADGEDMVAEKRSRASATFGENAEALMALPFVEFLTTKRLQQARPELRWKRHRVLYPLWYELRPVTAKLQRRRAPSRFDLWECVVA